MFLYLVDISLYSFKLCPLKSVVLALARVNIFFTSEYLICFNEISS